MRRYFLNLSSLFVLSILVSCNATKLYGPGDGPGDTGKSLPFRKTTALSWSSIKTGVLGSCMDCHIGHTSPELGSLLAVRQNLTRILSEIKSNSMPPARNGYSPLSDCAKQILVTWANQNAPETTDILAGSLSACQNLPDAPSTGPGDKPISEMPLTYQTLVSRILQPKCLRCHNDKSEDIEAAGVLFYPYQEILNRPHLWETPGAESKIVHSLTNEDQDEIMPPPQDSGPLSQDEVEFVIRWIDAGKAQ